MFGKLLIANRGEILGRICRTCKAMGIATVAVYSEADRFVPPVLAADEAVGIGPAPAAASYLNIDAIIAACRDTGAEAVHPGYGFLSERVEFAERLAAAGIVFIGPRPGHLRDFGLKHTARALAQKAGVPMLPGTGVLASADEARREAARIGYPVMLKSSAGGGGIGMVLCATPEELAERFAGIARLAANNFGDASLFLEKYVASARHIEVQVFGDGKGGVVALGARDCSLQRRNQKVVEETPPPNLLDAVLRDMQDAAVALAASVAYESAGTVEFVYDAGCQEFYFLEVNTRLAGRAWCDGGGVRRRSGALDDRAGSGRFRVAEPGHADRPRCRHRGAGLCRGPKRGIPAVQRHAHRLHAAGRFAGRQLGRGRHCRVAVL